MWDKIPARLLPFVKPQYQITLRKIGAGKIRLEDSYISKTMVVALYNANHQCFMSRSS